MAGKYVILPGSNAGSMFVWRKDRSVYILRMSGSSYEPGSMLVLTATGVAV